MKKIMIILYVGGFIFYTCDSRLDSIKSLNQPPIITVNGKNDIHLIEDSIKISLKNTQRIYAIDVSVTDPNQNLILFSPIFIDGGGFIQMDGDPVKNQGAVSFDPLVSVFYDPTSEGAHEFHLIAVDIFDESSQLTIKLDAFNNLKPVAAFDLNHVGINDPLEYLIDGSASYDQDRRFGGKVVQFKFTVLEQEIPSSDPVLPYIFPNAGNYQVSLLVQDNDGAWSEIITKNINIE